VSAATSAASSSDRPSSAAPISGVPTSCWLASGGGNDFLALVEPSADPSAEQIAAWCARGVSVGADGLFTLRRTGEGVAMSYWNADGKPAALCVNGTRCAARLALELGWADGALSIATGAGVLKAERLGATTIALELPPPAMLPRATSVEIDGRAHEGWFVAVGVPHFVVVWPESLAACPVATLGARLRHHAEFAPAGTNVDFVRFPDRNRLEIRSFERGVEAETLACGTGVLAAVAVGLQAGLAKLPVVARTMGGFELVVDGATVDSAPSRWTLAGDARLLATLELTGEAALPAPGSPRWAE
jgi:diaminopimelate epimerase